MGLFFNREREASDVFEGIKAEYEATKVGEGCGSVRGSGGALLRGQLSGSCRAAFRAAFRACLVETPCLLRCGRRPFSNTNAPNHT